MNNQEFIRLARQLVKEQLATAQEIRARYREMRQCTATTKAGARCKAWSLWNAPVQLCSGHYYKRRGAHGSWMWAQSNRYERNRTRPKCDCEAYPFPHKPGAGYCRWPAAPIWIHDLEAGKRRPGSIRRSRVMRVLRKYGWRG